VLFTGDLPLYVYQLSFIYFNCIRNSFVVYTSCFPSQMTSACVTWAKRQVDELNSALRRQLSNIDRESEVFGECMARAREHAAMLSDVGLDFKDLVVKGLSS